MALKINGTEVISDNRTAELTTDVELPRGSGNVEISSSGTITGDGYSIGGVKTLTASAKAFSNTVFTNGTYLITRDCLSPQQGSISGYVSGGEQPPQVNTIEKFPFASDGNATDVGDLTQARYGVVGQSSSVSGYTSGGVVIPSSPFYKNTIDKFPFVSDGNATDVGNLTRVTSQASGQSSSVSGYTSGGFGGAYTNVIDKFPFATDGNATDVGDLTLTGYQLTGQSSLAHGYVSSLNSGASIEKFSFASDSNSTAVGNLSQSRIGGSGQSSSENGYVSGGSPACNTIDKFPFASDGNATDVGDLTIARREIAGQSSVTQGYASGGAGRPGPPYKYNTIDKFPFASDENATDVGDLTSDRSNFAGQQSGGNA